jgi:cell division septation protein DedD
MKVICPKCQFENQADSTRVVCARCATIIEVRGDQGPGFDANGKRQTARLPFAANSNSNNNSGNLNSGNFGRGNSGSLGGPQNRDVYATRIGDDFDDVLELPRAPQGEFSNTAEATPVFEDVFSTSNYDSGSNYDFSAYEKKPTAPAGPYPTDTGGQRVTQDYAAPSEPEFMGWPVLPENSPEEEDAAPGFSGSRSGMFLRVGLLVAAFGVLSFLAYYFLWDYVARRKENADDLNTALVQAGGAAAGGVSSNPSTGAAPVELPKTASASPTVQKVESPVKGGARIDITPTVAGPSGPSRSPKPPATQSADVMPAPPNRGNLTIQAGSFPDKGQADERVSKLTAAGADARAIRADIPGKGTWYRVQIGGFQSRDDASRYGNQLRSKGLLQDFIVVTIGKP